MQLLVVFRFLLALFIVCAQLQAFIPNPDNDFLYKFRAFTPIGNVIGILLISGYLIAHSFARNPDNFYNRRLLRIYPLYFLAIIVSLLPFIILGSKVQLINGAYIEPDFGPVIGYLLLLQGFVFGSFAANPPLWPLGILVSCYLLTPVFAKLSTKVLALIILISGALYLGVPYFYQMLYSSELPYYSYLGYNLPFVLFLWAWLLGFLYFRESDKIPMKFLLFGGAIMLLINQQRTGKIALIVYIFTCLLLILLSHIKLPRLLSNMFNYFGDITYPFYLFHIPTFILSQSFLGVKNSPTLLILALLVGMVFYHAIDLPLRSRKLVTQESAK